MENCSIIEYFGASNDDKCGYCNQAGNYNSYGFWAYSLNVDHYQSLIDRNWRRSGQYCYVPNNKNTCCPMYTIKCDTSNFKLSGNHKKVLKKVNRFLRDGNKEKNHTNDQDIQPGMCDGPKPSKKQTSLDVNELSSIENKTCPLKKKSIRLERKINNLAAKELTLADVKKRNKSNQKTLEDFLAEEPTNGKHKLQVCIMKNDLRSMKVPGLHSIV